ncbi:SGNH/GDSL hydrolase family protein [Coraliomargarita sp. W4R53]
MVSGGGALCRRNDNSRFEGKLFRGKPVDLAYPPVVDRWEEMNTDTDLIFILIGTNDASSGVPLGPVDSLNQKEFNGGLNILLPGLKERSPDSVIIISTILKRRSGGATLIPYNKAIKDAAERHGVICYDAHSLVGLDLGQELRDKSLTNTADGLHPNAAGAKIIGNKIAEFINDNYHNMP